MGSEMCIRDRPEGGGQPVIVSYPAMTIGSLGFEIHDNVVELGSGHRANAITLLRTLSIQA